MSEALIIDSDRPADPIGKTLDIICRAFAICSGLMLTGMALMSVYSIVGRSFFDKPLLGDYELVQMISAVAVTMALPFCQMVKGHIIVDFFTLHAPRRVNATLDTIAGLLLAICAFAFAWRIVIATFEFRQNHDASMLLNLPTWWGYAPMGPSFFLLGCAALYTTWKDVKGMRA